LYTRRILDNIIKGKKLNQNIDPGTGHTSVSPSFEEVNEITVLEELMFRIQFLEKWLQKTRSL